MHPHRHIDKLLERYFNGDTSLEQERELQEYFHSGNIRSEHRELLPLFEYFRRESSAVESAAEPAGTVSGESAGNGQAALPEKFSGKRALSGNQRKIRLILLGKSWKLPAAAAAFILLALGVLLLQSIGDPGYQLKIEGKNIKNKELALAMAREKLGRFDRSLQQAGTRTAGVLKVSGAARKLELLGKFRVPLTTGIPLKEKGDESLSKERFR